MNKIFRFTSVCHHRFYSSKLSILGKSSIIPTLRIPGNSSLSSDEISQWFIDHTSSSALFMANSPLILELSDCSLPFANETLDKLLNHPDQKVRIIGLTGQTAADKAVAGELADSAGLAFISSTRKSPSSSAAAMKNRTAVSSSPSSDSTASPSSCMFVRQSLRSGQHVYATNQSLCILGNVHSGAEAWADGDVFVFGGLHGRAFAGVSGDKEAKIICNHFNAELVSLADMYLSVESTPEEVVPHQPTVCFRTADDEIEFYSTSRQSLPSQLILMQQQGGKKQKQKQNKK